MLRQKIVDTHVHLSPKVSPKAAVAAAAIESELAVAGVSRAIVLHLISQPWSAEDFAAAIANHPRLRGFVNVDPHAADVDLQLRQAVEKLGFIGLKLHPRLQKFELSDPASTHLVALAGEMGIPVLIDAFPDGDWLMMGFDPLRFAKLAIECPRTQIIIGHFGGHHCIDFMMLAKRIPNMWFDLSYSLLYYEGSAIIDNLLYSCRSLNFRRVFFGSDYPDRSIQQALQMSMEVFTMHELKPPQLDALLWRNAAEFFGWTDI